MSKNLVFDVDYYFNSEKSNYVNYNNKNFKQLAKDIIDSVNIKSIDKVLDFGCANGGLVNSLLGLNIDVFGTDISYWAIKNGREKYALKQRLQYYNLNLLEADFKYLICLDVLEHIHLKEVDEIFNIIKIPILIFRIPVSLKSGEDYYLDVSRKDITHKKAYSKLEWRDYFLKYGYVEDKILNKTEIYDSDGVLCRTYINTKYL